MSLTCPACSRAIAANPLGRWFQKFHCPHCRAPLQFSRMTNLLGGSSAIVFAALAVFVTFRGGDAFREPVAQAGIIAWVGLMAASYFARRAVKA